MEKGCLQTRVLGYCSIRQGGGLGDEEIAAGADCRTCAVDRYCEDVCIAMTRSPSQSRGI